MRPPPVPDRFQRRLRRISRFRAGVAETRSAPSPRLSMASALLAAIVVGLAVALAVWRLYGLRH